MADVEDLHKKTGRHGRMFNLLINTVDKVFYHVYDGEPVVGKGRRRRGTIENILEEEVLFCKNNVRVQIVKNVEKYDEDFIAGYMCIKKIYRADNEISDLMLSWVPNSLLAAGTTDEAEILSDTKNDNISTEASNLELEEKLNITKEENKNNKNDPVTLNKEFETPLGSVFSINLIDVKAVKLFYTSSDKECGQFVIGSHENEYKVFHFQSSGLIKLTEIFDQWKGCLVDSDLLADEVGQQVYYIAEDTKPLAENGRDLHPEEGRFKAMNMLAWQSCVNQLGQIADGFNFRKHVFFGGLSQEVRPDAWKFLLYYYAMHSSTKEREIMKVEKSKSYDVIHNKRLSLCGDEYETFWKKVQFTVDKDVVRTDRSHPYYAGQDNPNIQKMRNILLNYAIYNPVMGYTQGMSDLVAPVLATLHDEVDSFWCFVGLMQFSMFATTPTDDSMDKSLGFLRELLRIMLPEFYMHCLCQDYDLDLLFAHRWLVLCFKREFIFHEVLKIWEACWARYQTDYFHIFICVSIVSVYGDICLQKKMDTDEILRYFTDMALKFDGSAVLKEARSMLYKFRQLNRIPCSLRGLLSGKGVWDGGISPEVECISCHQRCCFEFVKQNKLSVKKQIEDNPETAVIDDVTLGHDIITKRKDIKTESNDEISCLQNVIENEEIHNNLTERDHDKTRLDKVETIHAEKMIDDDSIESATKDSVKLSNSTSIENTLTNGKTDRCTSGENEEKDLINKVEDVSLEDKFVPDNEFSNASMY